MSKILLISDANILIDMDVGGLLEPMFKLDYEFGTPDILYYEELAEMHPHLLDMGLRAIELTEESMRQVSVYAGKYSHTGVSSYDLSTMTLSQQEEAPLLTGDRKLHQICVQENVEVHGTIWLVGELIEAELITTDEAGAAYRKMKDDGSRLPWDEVEKQLKNKKEND